MIFFYSGYKKLPPCYGHKSWTAYGYDYDCDAPYIENIEDCSDCLCCYNIGGSVHPETGKKEKGIKSFIKYGFRKRH